jgi:putative Holliday junction resolvase
VKILAIDLGERRIGVALSDSAGILASPYTVVERSGDRGRDHRRIAELVEDTGAGCLVVGLPLTLKGEDGAAATAARTEASELAAVLPVPVELFDERLTTVEAARRRRDREAADRRPARSAGGGGGGAGAGGERRRRKPVARGAAARVGIDSEAAAILLESYLAVHPPAPEAAG